MQSLRVAESLFLHISDYGGNLVCCPDILTVVVGNGMCLRYPVT